MQLSPHFSLQEMTASQVAKRHGYDNTPNAGEIRHLERLCLTLLEPMREALGVPLHINSGYRSPTVNLAVGGKTASAHLDGRAADFVPAGIGVEDAFTQLAALDLPWDQLILEYGSWIHAAIARDGVEPRRQVLVLP